MVFGWCTMCSWTCIRYLCPNILSFGSTEEYSSAIKQYMRQVCLCWSGYIMKKKIRILHITWSHLLLNRVLTHAFNSFSRICKKLLTVFSYRKWMSRNLGEREHIFPFILFCTDWAFHHVVVKYTWHRTDHSNRLQVSNHWHLMHWQCYIAITAIKFPNTFISPEGNPMPSKQSLPVPLSISLLCLYNLPYLSISFKQNHTICGLLCLCYFIQYSVFEVHSCHCMYQYFHFIDK